MKSRESWARGRLRSMMVAIAGRGRFSPDDVAVALALPPNLATAVGGSTPNRRPVPILAAAACLALVCTGASSERGGNTRGGVLTKGAGDSSTSPAVDAAEVAEEEEEDEASVVAAAAAPSLPALWSIEELARGGASKSHTSASPRPRNALAWQHSHCTKMPCLPRQVNGGERGE